ncbi:MAG: ribonuclease Y [Ignavibacteriales bacterium]|nr:ribonuclease Y [Ignavibacteriales bacterium]
MDFDTIFPILYALLAGGIGFILGWYLKNNIGKNKIANADARAKRIIEDAERDAANLKKEKLLEVKDEWFKKKQEHEHEANARRNKLQSFEKQLESREDNLERKVDMVNKKEKEITGIKRTYDEKIKLAEDKQNQLSRLLIEENIRLERVSGMSREDAKKLLIENLTDEAKSEAAQTLKEIRDITKADAKKEAQKVIIQAIQRSATDHCVESTVSVLQIQNDEMKGRIIGKEGRNIRAFEAATGVDVIVDDTPEAVILSAFDPLRREVARLALERLITDGRIHPARIEEIVEKVNKDLDEELLHSGENTMIEVGITGGSPELLRHLGRMKYRSSYGQNLLSHSIEVSHLTGLMAAELGLDITMAKRAGLLHDIGKTVDRSVEGPHALIGYDLVKKMNEHPIIINSVGSHHDDMPIEYPIAALVQAADAISGSRPGARRESIEAYAKRMERLEEMAKSFQGVAQTYAIQAGREIRVIVEHDKIDDAMADILAHDIAKKIQSEMGFPGQIKVVVIREKRSVAFAK